MEDPNSRYTYTLLSSGSERVNLPQFPVALRWPLQFATTILRKSTAAENRSKYSCSDSLIRAESSPRGTSGRHRCSVYILRPVCSPNCALFCDFRPNKCATASLMLVMKAFLAAILCLFAVLKHCTVRRSDDGVGLTANGGFRLI